MGQIKVNEVNKMSGQLQSKSKDKLGNNLALIKHDDERENIAHTKENIQRFANVKLKMGRRKNRNLDLLPVAWFK
ncbi:MAG: hypothetical protein ABIR06_16710 [Cyclobacteriaceae bacterium]